MSKDFSSKAKSEIVSQINQIGNVDVIPVSRSYWQGYGDYFSETGVESALSKIRIYQDAVYNEKQEGQSFFNNLFEKANEIDLRTGKNLTNSQQGFKSYLETMRVMTEIVSKKDLPSMAYIGSKLKDLTKSLKKDVPTIKEKTEKAHGIVDLIKNIIEDSEDAVGKFSKFTSKVNKVTKFVVGAKDLIMRTKDGYVIVSQFVRKGFFNTLVKHFNDGIGIGTRYLVETIQKKKVLGTIYKVGRFTEIVGKASNILTSVVTGGAEAYKGVNKIIDIQNDDSLTDKEKTIKTAATAGTTTVATALRVGAPFAGTAVTAAIPIPGVNVVAGMAVQGIMDFSADVITSEEVVAEVENTIENVAAKASEGIAVVSDAAKDFVEAEGFGNKVEKGAELVGKAVVSAGETVVEFAKGSLEIQKEMASVAVDKVVDGAKAMGKKISGWGKSIAGWFD